MKNRINSIFTLSAVMIISILLLTSCTKNKIITPNTTASLFASTEGSYFITSDPNTVYKIPLGITRVPDKSVSIQFTVSSPSGAVEGQQYTLASNKITIPAGQTVDSIALNGIFSAYPTGRTDTLIFTITGGDVPALVGSEVFTLVLQKYCDVIESQITGDYTNTIDYYSGDPSTEGPYTATITNWVSMGATTATANIINLGATSDNGWGPFDPSDPAINPGIKATFDWTDAASFKVFIGSQNYFPLGGGFAPISASNGTFSSCSNTITIPFTVVYRGGSYVTTTILMR